MEGNNVPSTLSIVGLLHEVAIQEGDHLSAGTRIIRAEGGSAGAHGDLLLIGPLNGLCVILISLDIVKDEQKALHT